MGRPIRHARHPPKPPRGQCATLRATRAWNSLSDEQKRDFEENADNRDTLTTAITLGGTSTRIVTDDWHEEIGEDNDAAHEYLNGLETLLNDSDAQYMGELWDGADPEGDESYHWLYYTPTNLTEARDSYRRALAETKRTPHRQANQKKRARASLTRRVDNPRINTHHQATKKGRDQPRKPWHRSLPSSYLTLKQGARVGERNPHTQGHTHTHAPNRTHTRPAPHTRARTRPTRDPKGDTPRTPHPKMRLTHRGTPVHYKKHTTTLPNTTKNTPHKPTNPHTPNAPAHESTKPRARDHQPATLAPPDTTPPPTPTQAPQSRTRAPNPTPTRPPATGESEDATGAEPDADTEPADKEPDPGAQSAEQINASTLATPTPAARAHRRNTKEHQLSPNTHTAHGTHTTTPPHEGADTDATETTEDATEPEAGTEPTDTRPEPDTTAPEEPGTPDPDTGTETPLNTNTREPTSNETPTPPPATASPNHEGAPPPRTTHPTPKQPHTPTDTNTQHPFNKHRRAQEHTPKEQNNNPITTRTQKHAPHRTHTHQK